MMIKHVSELIKTRKREITKWMLQNYKLKLISIKDLRNKRLKQFENKEISLQRMKNKESRRLKTTNEKEIEKLMTYYRSISKRWENWKESNLIDNRRDRSRRKKTKKKTEDLLIKETWNLKQQKESLLRRKKRSWSFWNKKTMSMNNLSMKRRRGFSKLTKICLRDTKKITMTKSNGTMIERTDWSKTKKKWEREKWSSHK